MTKEPTQREKDRKVKQAIKMLNDICKIKLAPSTIHGVGVFAMRDLKKGETLYADAIPNALDIPYKLFGQLNPEVKELVLSHWPNIINGSHFLYPVTKMSAFMNHSDDPNVDAKEDRVLRKIKKGEELTEDYRLIINAEKLFAWLNK